MCRSIYFDTLYSSIISFYTFLHTAASLYYIFFIVLVHNALSLMMGYYTGKAVGLSLQDRKTVSIETGIQNSGLALALLFNPRIFPVELNVGGMAFIAAWWGVWHIIAGLTIAGIWSGFSLKSPVKMT